MSEQEAREQREEVPERRHFRRRDEDICPFRDVRDALLQGHLQLKNGGAGNGGNGGTTATAGKDEPRFSQFQQWLITFLIAGMVTIFIWWSTTLNASDKAQLESLAKIEKELISFKHQLETLGREAAQTKGEMQRLSDDLKLHMRETPSHPSFLPQKNFKP